MQHLFCPLFLISPMLCVSVRANYPQCSVFNSSILSYLFFIYAILVSVSSGGTSYKKKIGDLFSLASALANVSGVCFGPLNKKYDVAACMHELYGWWPAVLWASASSMDSMSSCFVDGEEWVWHTQSQSCNDTNCYCSHAFVSANCLLALPLVFFLARH